jgi:hypothetical protein
LYKKIEVTKPTYHKKEQQSIVGNFPIIFTHTYANMKDNIYTYNVPKGITTCSEII